jgi:hypothetical protein
MVVAPLVTGRQITTSRVLILLNVAVLVEVPAAVPETKSFFEFGV